MDLRVVNKTDGWMSEHTLENTPALTTTKRVSVSLEADVVLSDTFPGNPHTSEMLVTVVIDSMELFLKVDSVDVGKKILEDLQNRGTISLDALKKMGFVDVSDLPID